MRWLQLLLRLAVGKGLCPCKFAEIVQVHIATLKVTGIIHGYVALRITSRLVVRITLRTTKTTHRVRAIEATIAPFQNVHFGVEYLGVNVTIQSSITGSQVFGTRNELRPWCR